MPKLDVKKSILINAPAEKIYKIISDFNNWRPWSPWLIMEPEATMTVAEGGKYYEWEGKRVGTGNMTVEREDANKSIDYDLTFLTPFKSKAKTSFELVSKGENQTEVSWLMDSRLPFFMFWMKKAMTAYIGMDYERGLAMLKDYAEDDQVHSKLDFEGTSNFPGCTYVGIKTDCTIKTVGESMAKDFGKLEAFFTDHKDLIAGAPISIYHKWDMVGGKVSYTSAIPVKSIPDNLPAGMISGSIPETKIYSVKHTGPYGHLGNAWSTMMNLQRGKVFKAKKGIHPFEAYVNDPKEVSDKELETTVNFAVK